MKNIPFALLSLGAIATSANAGTFANINIDGDFTDWTTIPIALTDANEGFGFDIDTIQIAHNDTNVFFRITYNQMVNPQSGSGLFLGIDNDSNLATGFDVYSQGIIGVEAAYQNDFPFEQATGVFNTGATANAPIAISPYNSSTPAQEFSISRTAVIDTASGQLVFPNDSFNFVAYFNDADSDVSGVASYTIPEPTSSVLLGVFALATLGRRRRKSV